MTPTRSALPEPAPPEPAPTSAPDKTSAATPSGRTTWIPGLVTSIAVASLVLGLWMDWRSPTSADWATVGVLAAVAVAAALTGWWLGPPDEESTPPWSVHTLWLMPAALTVPPLAFLPLVILSVVFSFSRRAHSVATRLVVASITAITSVEVHWLAQIFDSLMVAGLLSVIALHVTGTLIALLAAFAFTGPAGTAIWLDYRWTFVQLGCEFSGLLTAVAMAYTPLAGFLALAPVLMAEFTLNWPELDRHARIDAKTGLSNARYWEDRSRDLISAARLHETPVAVAILDIDHFKAVNDTYGHLVGDVVLEACAATLRTQVNPGDVIGRFGGEEFVITLFGLTPDGAHSVADRIRVAIGSQLHDGGRSGAKGEYDVSPLPGAFSITCTIGFATSDEYGFDLTELLAAADQALAEGKASGRDTVHRAAAPQRTAARRGRSESVGEVPEAIRIAGAKRKWIDVANQQRSTVRRRLRRQKPAAGR